MFLLFQSNFPKGATQQCKRVDSASLDKDPFQHDVTSKDMAISYDETA